MRRFFRFSVRDLLWLTLVVALVVAWWIDSRQLTASLDEERLRANNLQSELAFYVKRVHELEASK